MDRTKTVSGWRRLAGLWWTLAVALLPVMAQDAGLPETIRVMTLKGPTGMGMFSLMESGWLVLGNGRKVRLEVELAGTPDLVDARLVSGQVDFCTLPVNQAARLYNKGAGIQLGGVNVWGVLYLVSTELPTGDSRSVWQALAGKTIHSTGKGASPDAVFRTLAQKNGLDPERDLVLDYRFNQMQLATMMLEGQIKTAFLPEPFATRVLAGVPAARVAIDLQQDWAVAFAGARIAQGGIVVRRDFARQWPELTKAFLAAYAGSTAQATTAADAPARIEKLGLGIDAKSFALARQRLNLEYRSAVESKADVLVYLGVLQANNPADIGGRLPDGAFFFQ